MNRKPVIAVVGGGECTGEIEKIAEAVGEEIAESGAILICGGKGGVMEASCRGAKQKGGVTIGILPSMNDRDANPYIDIPIVTGIGYARNMIIALTADVLIAVSGKYGTLTEIAYGLHFNKPVIALQSWDFDEKIIKAATPKEAVALALQQLF